MGARSYSKKQNGGEERIRTSGKVLPLQPLSRRLPSATRPPLPYVWMHVRDSRLYRAEPSRSRRRQGTSGARDPALVARRWSARSRGLHVNGELHDLRKGRADRFLDLVADLVPAEDGHRGFHFHVHVGHVIETHLP